MQAGIKFKLKNEKLGLNSTYVITKSEHTIEATTERVKMSIKKITEQT